MLGESKLFYKNFKETQCLFTQINVWRRAHSCVNFCECFIYLSLPQNLLSPNHELSIFLTNGPFVHKLHNQIGSRINCWKWNFLILTLVTANEDGWDKAGTELCGGGDFIPHCVGQRQICLQRIKTESSNCLMLGKAIVSQPAQIQTFIKNQV